MGWFVYLDTYISTLVWKEGIQKVYLKGTIWIWRNNLYIYNVHYACSISPLIALTRSGSRLWLVVSFNISILRFVPFAHCRSIASTCWSEREDVNQGHVPQCGFNLTDGTPANGSFRNGDWESAVSKIKLPYFWMIWWDGQGDGFSLLMIERCEVHVDALQPVDDFDQPSRWQGRQVGDMEIHFSHGGMQTNRTQELSVDGPNDHAGCSLKPPWGNHLWHERQGFERRLQGDPGPQAWALPHLPSPLAHQSRFEAEMMRRLPPAIAEMMAVTMLAGVSIPSL